jgi:hypothetical protein
MVNQNSALMWQNTVTVSADAHAEEALAVFRQRTKVWVTDTQLRVPRPAS